LGRGIIDIGNLTDNGGGSLSTTLPVVANNGRSLEDRPGLKSTLIRIREVPIHLML
jgi:hypothetical protein